MTLDRPIFVTGTPRAGKSCIARIVALDPNFTYAMEPLAIWDTGFGMRPDDCRGAEDATPALRSMIESRCINIVARANAKRYLDALSYHALRIPFLMSLLPNAKVIHVVREPEYAIPEMIYGWTLSEPMINTIRRRKREINFRTLPRLAVRFLINYFATRRWGHRKSWGPRVPGLTAFAQSHSPAEIAAFQWARMVEIAMDDLAKQPTDRWMQVCFDDLLANPKSVLAQIGSFAEVENPTIWHEQASAFLDPTRTTDKLVTPSATEWDAIRKIIASARDRMAQLRPTEFAGSKD